MHAGEPPGSPEAVATEPRQVTGPGEAAQPGPPAIRRWWAASAWIAALLALFGVLLRISLSSPINSDGANSALQAWSLLHGNFLLHGWIIGDATYYTFELPVDAVLEHVLGLHPITLHVGSAITFAIVTACAVALAVGGSRGAARVARGAVVIVVLAAALLTPLGVAILLEKPDHTGTSAIMLAAFLLLDRLPSRWFTPPLLCAILIAGQLGDATVLYVGVPAVLGVCLYRVIAARTIRTADAAIVVAAAASVPLARLIRSAIEHHGGYLMVAPKIGIAPFSTWQHHAWLTLKAFRVLYGSTAEPGSALGFAGEVLGTACLLAAALGFVRVLWRWRTAGRAEQMLCVAIVFNIGAYMSSTIPVPTNEREIVAVLPFGAVLAARACVPERIASTSRGRLAVTVATAAALVPLVAAAAVSPAPQPASVLASWLKAHGLTYGLAGYWGASSTTVQSGGLVDVRAVEVTFPKGRATFVAKDWETNASWYNPALHDATFIVAATAENYHGGDSFVARTVEWRFGRPSSTYLVGRHLVMIYSKNLLLQVQPALPLPEQDGASGVL